MEIIDFHENKVANEQNNVGHRKPIKTCQLIRDKRLIYLLALSLSFFPDLYCQYYEFCGCCSDMSVSKQ